MPKVIKKEQRGGGISAEGVIVYGVVDIEANKRLDEKWMNDNISDMEIYYTYLNEGAQGYGYPIYGYELSLTQEPGVSDILTDEQKEKVDKLYDFLKVERPSSNPVSQIEMGYFTAIRNDGGSPSVSYTPSKSLDKNNNEDPTNTSSGGRRHRVRKAKTKRIKRKTRKTRKTRKYFKK